MKKRPTQKQGQPDKKKKRKNFKHTTQQTKLEHFFSKSQCPLKASKTDVLISGESLEFEENGVVFVSNDEVNEEIPTYINSVPPAESSSSLEVSTSFSKSSTNRSLNEFDSSIGGNDSFEALMDTDIIKFDPAKLKWNVPSQYRFLCATFALIDKTSSRLKIINYLTNMLRVLIYHDPASVLPAVWLSSNAIAPPYDGVELGVGGQVLTKAVTSVSDCSSKTLKQYYEKHGDWGDVAYAAKVSLRTLLEPKPLTIEMVYNTLVSISRLKGNGTVDQKTDLVKKLLIASKGEEVRYLTRTLIQNLRIGAVRTTCLIALARAFCLGKPAADSTDINSFLSIDVAKETRNSIDSKLKQAEALLKECYARFPNYNGIVNSLLEHPMNKLLEVCPLTVGVPLLPMLGKITRDLPSVFKRLDGKPFNYEFKYDGQRAQIHMDEKGRVFVFSRHLENVTGKFPDIVDIIPRICSNSVASFIMDSEVVAINQGGKLRNFQTLSNRSRKNVSLSSITVPICIFAFDLMYLNGQPLLKKTLRERRDLLKGNFVEIPNRFTLVRHIESSDQDEVHNFFKESIKAGCEGIMVKILDDPPPSLDSKTRSNLLASYEPDKRLESWLKVKKDYVDGVGDSLDVVPIAAWHGSGRKASWWSPILLAVYNPDTEMLESVCKCISGFSDEFYKEMKSRYSTENGNLLTDKKRYFDVDGALKPDVWFEPQEVWEIRGADITISPVHKAAHGKVDQSKGLSLRFPRFFRVRMDKGIEDATTSDQLAEMYYKQVKEQNEEQNEDSGEAD